MASLAIPRPAAIPPSPPLEPADSRFVANPTHLSPHVTATSARQDPPPASPATTEPIVPTDSGFSSNPEPYTADCLGLGFDDHDGQQHDSGAGPVPIAAPTHSSTAITPSHPADQMFEQADSTISSSAVQDASDRLAGLEQRQADGHAKSTVTTVPPSREREDSQPSAPLSRQTSRTRPVVAGSPRLDDRSHNKQSSVGAAERSHTRRRTSSALAAEQSRTTTTIMGGPAKPADTSARPSRDTPRPSADGRLSASVGSPHGFGRPRQFNISRRTSDNTGTGGNSRSRRSSRRNRNDDDDDRVMMGTKVDHNHVNWVTAYNMLTGIRFTVSRTNAKLDQPLGPEHFAATHKLSFDITGNELTPSAKYDFKFKDYAPWVFRKLRNIFQLDPADYLMSLTSKYILSELGSPGKSGSFFYFSRDYKYIIKTIHHGEHKFLRRILERYYKHAEKYPNTLLSQFYGLHRVKIPYGRKIHFVVMNNLFPPNRDIHQTFDLKGSTIGRVYDEAEVASHPRATLKDINWMRRDRAIEFGPHKSAEFLNQLHRDVELLKQLHVMDYSLLIGIHDRSRGNGEFLRDKTLKVFHPTDHDPAAGPAGPDGGLIRTPSNIENERKASALRGKVLKQRPVPLNQDSQMHRELNQDRVEKKSYFYREEGGIIATDEHDHAGREIYYLGVIDCLTHYGKIKRMEHFLKGLTHNEIGLSALPPQRYGDRFFRFISGIVAPRASSDERGQQGAGNVRLSDATNDELSARIQAITSKPTEFVPRPSWEATAASRPPDQHGYLDVVDEAGEVASEGSGRRGRRSTSNRLPPVAPESDFRPPADRLQFENGPGEAGVKATETTQPHPNFSRPHYGNPILAVAPVAATMVVVESARSSQHGQLDQQQPVSAMPSCADSAGPESQTGSEKPSSVPDASLVLNGVSERAG